MTPSHPTPTRSSLANFIALILVSALVVGCAGTLIPKVTSTDAARAGTTMERLEEGRRLYVAKCTGCHAPLAPSALSADEWRHEVHEMGELTNIDAQSTELVIGFLVAFSRDASGGDETVAEIGPVAAPREAAHP